MWKYKIVFIFINFKAQLSVNGNNLTLANPKVEATTTGSRNGNFPFENVFIARRVFVTLNKMLNGIEGGGGNGRKLHNGDIMRLAAKQNGSQ